MKADAPNVAVNTSRASHNAIKLPRPDLQAQKWRLSLESEILKHYNPLSLTTPAQTTEWTGQGQSTDQSVRENAVATESASVRAGTVEPGHVDPTAMLGQAQLLQAPAHQTWTQTLGMVPHAVAQRNTPSRTDASINALTPSRLQREVPAAPNANHWTVAKQGDGAVLTYVGPAVAYEQFREMADLCCLFMKEQGIKVVRVINNGIIVWDEQDFAGSDHPELMMDTLVQSDAHSINKKY